MKDKKLSSILSFYINGEMFAFNTDAVRNILELTVTTKVPNTKKYFEGIINLHGNIIPVVDLRKIMGASQKRNSKDAATIIVSNDGQASSLIGMVVDGVKEVYILSEEDKLLETLVDINHDSALKLSFTGTLNINENFIHVINLDDLAEEIEN